MKCYFYHEETTLYDHIDIKLTLKVNPGPTILNPYQNIQNDFKMFVKCTAADRWLIGFAFSFCATAGGCKNNPRNTVLPLLPLMILADVTCVRGVCVKLPAILWVKPSIMGRVFCYLSLRFVDFFISLLKKCFFLWGASSSYLRI